MSKFEALVLSGNDYFLWNCDAEDIFEAEQILNARLKIVNANFITKFEIITIKEN